MGSPLSPLVKHEIISKRESGQSLRSIAAELEVSYGAAMNLWKRFQSEGEGGFVPRYHNNGRKGPDRMCLIFRAACWLKRLHRDWGAVVIHTKLKCRYGDEQLPSSRQMNRWFSKTGLSRRGSRMPQNPKQWAEEVHDVWQIDAKELVRPDSGGGVCWLTIVDEKSGALIEAPPFPPRENFQGPLARLQAGIGECVQRLGTTQGYQG
jgi:hypothetical protein